MTTISSQIATGAAWLVGLRLSLKSISILSTTILARLLTPEDFGLMALVSSIYAMIELIKAFSFDMALIQNQKTNNDHYDTAWTLNIISSCLASLFIVSVSSFISYYYHDGRLNTALMVIALMVFIDGFSNIGTVEFRKQLNFSQEFKYQILTKISSFVVTIPIAFYLHSYWALLIGMLFNTLISVILSYVLQEYRPRLSLKAKNDLLSFCSWLYINNILQFVNKNSQNFILGRTAGNNNLGIFSVADEVANMTTTEVIAPINRAAYPGYVKLAEQKGLLKEVYLKTISVIAMVSLPCATGIAVLAPMIVPILLGNQWFDAIQVIQIIALSSAVESLNTNASYIYITLKKQHVITRLLLLKTMILLPLLMVLSMRNGIHGAAFAILSTSVMLLPINFYTISKVLNIGWRQYIQFLYRPFTSCLIMTTAIYYLLQIQLDKDYISVFIYLVSNILVGILIFSCSVFLLWKMAGRVAGTESMILSHICNKFIDTK